MANCYVYAVCGDEKYFKDLAFSVSKLKKFTKSEIIVITDTSRNKCAVPHDNIIDIKTPERFDNHQASIWLKTTLNRYTNNYDICCYLDTDVIACNDEVDNIFVQKRKKGITFAPDHLSIKYFSPYAVNCGCLDEFNNLKKQLIELILKYNPYYTEENFENNFDARNFYRYRKQIRQNPLLGMEFLLKLAFSRLFKKNIVIGNYFYNYKDKTWRNSFTGKVVLFHAKNYSIFIEKESSFKFDRLKSIWYFKRKNLNSLHCNHLIEKLKTINGNLELDPNWQHPNGGVFVYDRSAENFFEKWNYYTLKSFNDNYFKTRDQTSLILTYKESGLTKDDYLSSKFNFICDFHNYDIYYEGTEIRHINGSRVKPVFVHLLNGMWRKGWDIWDNLSSI